MDTSAAEVTADLPVVASYRRSLVLLAAASDLPRASRRNLAQAAVPEFQCCLRWHAGDVAFWDHRSTQHDASSDYFPQRRLMRAHHDHRRPAGLTPDTVGQIGPAVVGAAALTQRCRPSPVRILPVWLR